MTTLDLEREQPQISKYLSYPKGYRGNETFEKGNTCHNPPGSPKGGEFCSTSGRTGGTGEKNKTKELLAKATYKPSTAAKQQVADKSEKYLASKLGMQRTENNSAFDLLKGKLGIEVKTLVDNSNDKITMHKSSLQRKVEFAKQKNLKTYTIVIDKRSKETKYYWREGLGSFRVKSLNLANSVDELKKVIK